MNINLKKLKKPQTKREIFKELKSLSNETLLELINNEEKAQIYVDKLKKAKK